MVQGTVLNGDDLATLADGLDQNELLHYDYMLTGYIGTIHFVGCIDYS